MKCEMCCAYAQCISIEYSLKNIDHGFLVVLPTEFVVTQTFQSMPRDQQNSCMTDGTYIV